MTYAEKPNVLIVDDTPANLIVLGGILEDLDINLVKAQSGQEALSIMLAYDFALVLLDVQMPEMDGFETAELMRGRKNTKHIPIIFVTAVSKSPEHVFKGYESGAVDYILKPYDPKILKSKVNIFIELYEQKKALNKVNKELESANQRVLEQQKSVIEEERLKVLLQLSGATAHELNQPLMGMLGIIELMKMDDHPSKTLQHLEKIEESAKRISGIVQNIQTIRHDETIPYAGEASIIKIDQKISLLVVEDSEEDFKMLNRCLNENDKITLVRAKTIKEAMVQLNLKRVDLIILDYSLPDGNGFDMLKYQVEGESMVPVVVITGQGNEVIASQIIQAGAYDYLPKDKVSSQSLTRVIMNALEKADLKRQVKEAFKRMVDMSTRDELTALYNRRYFEEALGREMERARRYNTELVLCMLDIDHFKQVNDTYGHSAGDKVLSKIGKLLKDSIRDNDIGCRYGGEEFAILLPHTKMEEASIMCERFRELVASYDFTYNSVNMSITVSIGMSQYKGGKDSDNGLLLDQADKALYQAKEGGRNRAVVYYSDFD